MGMDGMVRARLDLTFEGLRATCMEYLTQRQADVQAMVTAQLDAQLANGQLEKMIAATIQRELRIQLEQSIKDGIKHALWDRSAKNQLAELLLKGLNKFHEEIEE
jgi:hypothetical protein